MRQRGLGRYLDVVHVVVHGDGVRQSGAAELGVALAENRIGRDIHIGDNFTRTARHDAVDLDPGPQIEVCDRKLARATNQRTNEPARLCYPFSAR